VRDAARLALGTLTVLPVRPPARVDRRTGGRAMVLAPLVGAVLAVVLVIVLWVCRDTSAAVAGALAVAALALLTRGMHLDGLADTADGLGSGRGPEAALTVMRRGDVGPFGVVAVVLALVLQTSALSTLVARGSGAFPLVLALVTSRLVLPLLCSEGVPAARQDGLGSAVAGSVSRVALLGSVLLAAAVVVIAGGVVAATSGTGGVGWSDLLRAAVAAVLPLLAAGVLATRCVRRLGGITGDVLGASVEVAFTASLVLSSFR
jgi:adenosylcobinamide-GDP ribazoletransferase